jgi:hypothetical protein
MSSYADENETDCGKTYTGKESAKSSQVPGELCRSPAIFTVSLPYHIFSDFSRTPDKISAVSAFCRALDRLERIQISCTPERLLTNDNFYGMLSL